MASLRTSSTPKSCPNIAALPTPDDEPPASCPATREYLIKHASDVLAVLGALEVGEAVDLRASVRMGMPCQRDLDGDGAIGVDADIDACAAAEQNLVDRIGGDLKEKVQRAPAVVGPPNPHPGPSADCFAGS